MTSFIGNKRVGLYFAPELINLIALILWGIVIVNPHTDSFYNSQTYAIFLQLESTFPVFNEMFWGFSAITIGIINIAIVKLKLHKYRALPALLATPFWMTVLLLFFMANPSSNAISSHLTFLINTVISQYVIMKSGITEYDSRMGNSNNH